MAKISDKLAYVNQTFNVTRSRRHDNGFLVEVYGQCPNEDYDTTSLVVLEGDEVIELFREFLSLPIVK